MALFDTPEQVRARIGKTGRESDMNVAGMNRQQMSSAAASQAGRMFAQAGGQALGYENPEITRARTIQGIVSKIDPSNPYQGYINGAKEAQAAGLQNEAFKFLEAAQKFAPVAGKAPKTKTTGEMVDGEAWKVYSEWDSKANEWNETSRAKANKGQTFNMINSPVEKASARAFESSIEEANTAERSLFTVNKARTLLPNISTGKLAPAVTAVREWFDALGIPIDTTKMTDSVSFRSTMKGAVLDDMNSIKGNASKYEVQIVEDHNASLDNPIEANNFLLDTMESLAKRRIEKASFLETYAKKNGGKLLGSRTAWNKRNANVPMIKKVNNQPVHYYQYRDKAIAANAAYFREKGWSQSQINDAVDNLWKKEGN